MIIKVALRPADMRLSLQLLPKLMRGVMTGAQKDWLDKNKARGYRPRGNSGGLGWTDVGMLYPDGTFEKKLSRGWRYARAEDGMFEVGILVLPETPIARPFG